MELPQLRPASECVTGGCFKFDGVDDYVDVGNFGGIKGEKEVTITFWVKKKVNITHAGPVSGIGGSNSKILFLMLDSSNGGTDTNSFFISFCDGVNVKNLLSDHRLPIDLWEHVVVTFKSKDFVKIYSNGILNNSDNTVLEKLNSNPENNLLFGIYSSFKFNGYIDDIKIYNSALSSFLIKQNYIAGLNSLFSKGNISKEEYNQRIEKLGSR
ncbi:MAG TPA: LamG domain-containing protein [Candidatus Pacearchaeota archaeon]|nr:LamG domain-containing protein [Candidatus Pacearchaeota archaeon]